MWQILFLSVLCYAVPSTKVSDGIVRMTDIVFAQAGSAEHLTKDLKMDVAFPSVSDELLPAVVFIHGGGWEEGTKEKGAPFVRTLAAGGYFAASIEYRLTSEGGGYPYAVQDCLEAVHFLQKNAPSLGIDPKKIGLMGYSAGGHLAALAGLSANATLQNEEDVEQNSQPTVACIGIVNGCVLPEKIYTYSDSYKEWAFQNQEVVEKTFPSTYIDSSDPPVYLLCGEKDTLCRPRHAKEFQRLLKKKSVSCVLEIAKGQGHVITVPEAYLGLLEFYDSHLGGTGQTVLEEHLESKN